MDTEESKKRILGTVVRFDCVEGYGFISLPNSYRDIYVHCSDVEDTPKELVKGEYVEFEVQTSPKGDRAIKVRRVKKDYYFDAIVASFKKSYRERKGNPLNTKRPRPRKSESRRRWLRRLLKGLSADRGVSADKQAREFWTTNRRRRRRR